MTEPSRSEAARRYLERMGVPQARRAPARRAFVDDDDVTIGRARVESIEPLPENEDEVLGAVSPEGRAVGRMFEPEAEPEPTRQRFAFIDDDVGPDAPVEMPPGFDAESLEAGYRDVQASTPEARRARADAANRERLRASETRRMQRERDLDAAYDRSLLEGLSMDNRVNAVGEGVVQGLTLGWGDELGAAARATFSPTRRTRRTRGGREIELGRDWERDYQEERDRLRGNIHQAQREASFAYGAGELAGGTGVGLLVPGAGPGSSLARRVGASTLLGGAFGGVGGAGVSEADDMLGVGRDALVGAGMGAGMGGGVELLGAGARRAFAVTPEGTPTRGRDFTPDQIAEMERRMDAGDPDLFDMYTTREALEDAAAERRVRATAEGSTLSDVRRAGDYHGPGGEGYRGLARDLDATGIQPRGEITRAPESQRRAARLRNQSGRAIGEVAQRMDDAVRGVDDRILANADDELEMLGRRPPRVPEPELPPSPIVDRAALDRIDAATTPEWRASLDPETRRTLDSLDPAFARGNSRAQDQVGTGRARRGGRPEGVSLRDREGATVLDAAPGERPPRDVDPGYELIPADRVHRAVQDVADPALVRYSGTLPEIGPEGRVTQTPAGTTVQRLRQNADEALRSATTPEQRAAAQRLRELADDMERIGPERYSQAQARLRALDEDAAYGTQYPNAPQAAPDYVARSREARAGVRADMDAAVERTLGPDELRRLREQRGRYGAAEQVRQLGARGAERTGANLPVGLNDTQYIANAMGQNAPALTRIRNAIEGVITNRFLRGSLHSAGATVMEMQSDALAADIMRRLAQSPVTDPMARALAEAQRRGPRAFGMAVMRMVDDYPETMEVIAPAFEESDPNDFGVPFADQYEGGLLRTEEGAEAGADEDWGVPYADEYDEEEQRR